MELQIEYIQVDKLKPYEKNARKHDKKSIEAIKASIKEFGMSDPVGVWKDEIVEGHGRVIACKELGFSEIPIIRLDHLTDEQRRAYALAHNKTAELSEWDFDVLGGELDDIFDIDMGDFGFDLDEEEESDESEEKNIYTSKVDIPQYEPSGNKVTLGECCNEDKYSQLLKEIKESKLSEDEKAFLCLAAARHLQFNYKKIADYYASNASEEMQRLMEKSALVIIDYNDAIKNGYAVLRKTVTGLLEDE